MGDKKWGRENKRIILFSCLIASEKWRENEKGTWDRLWNISSLTCAEKESMRENNSKTFMPLNKVKFNIILNLYKIDFYLNDNFIINLIS